MPDPEDTLLLYAPVPLYESDRGYLLEDQACNGLRLWSQHFSKVIVMHPVEAGVAPPSWIPVSDAGIDLTRVELVPLPTAYRPDQFFRHFLRTRAVIRNAIKRARFLSFSIGGLFGDWGSVAAWEAHQMNRRFAIWTDRVESQVVKNDGLHATKWRRRLKARLMHRPMWALECFLIRRCTVGLFHGAETFAAYSPYAKVAELVHDIHLKTKDRISPDLLEKKILSANEGPLRICYLGRAEPMKGPFDWIRAMKTLHDRGVSFKARWLGNGELIEAMQEEIDRLGLRNNVELAGFVRDRKQVLDELQNSHLFVFCHKTPESPRNLIEALVSATPIVGYDGAYARDLISQHHGGVLTPINQPDELARAIEALANNRNRLITLFHAALQDAEPYNDGHVFEHRSMIIRRHLQ